MKRKTQRPVHLDYETIRAAEIALGQRLRVELVPLEDGTVAVQTVQRKRLKINHDPTA